MHRIWLYLVQSTQIEKCGVTIAACQFDRDVIDVTFLAPGELAAANLERADDFRKPQCTAPPRVHDTVTNSLSGLALVRENG